MKLDRVTPRRFTSEVISLPVALSQGPIRLTLAGATSSPGEKISVSITEKKSNPDPPSGPALKVEFVSWINGDVVVLDS